MTLADCKPGDRVRIFGNPYKVGKRGDVILGPDFIACYPQHAKGIMRLYPVQIFSGIACTPEKRRKRVDQ